MELTFLRGLYDTPGPWASVYFDATHDSPPALEAIRTRSKVIARRLSELGLDDGTRKAFEAGIINENTFRPLDTDVDPEQPHPGRHGLAVLASHGVIRYSEVLPTPPIADIAEVGPLPHLTPLLALRGEQIPWLRVVVDRIGADITGRQEGVVHVEGANTFPIRKVHGGASQEHFHRKAELNWLHNAQEVAEQVTRLAENAGAELLIVAGDVHARELLIGELPVRWRTRTVDSDTGSRAPGADLTALDELTAQKVAGFIAQRRTAASERFLANGGTSAANGLRAVAAAFDRGQVEILLLDSQRLADTPLLMSPDLAHLAASEVELAQLGAREIQQVRADDALIRAAAVTGAEVILATAGPDLPLAGGVGAVLRYADSATPRW